MFRLVKRAVALLASSSMELPAYLEIVLTHFPNKERESFEENWSTCQLCDRLCQFGRTSSHVSLKAPSV